MGANPRYANGYARRMLRKQLASERRPCWICEVFGRPASIDYSLPARHPMAFEVDELVPVSKYWLGGYATKEECAKDYANLAATHRRCNNWRKNKTVAEVLAIASSTHGKRSKKAPTRFMEQPVEF